MYFDLKNLKIHLLYDWWMSIVLTVCILFIVKYHWSRRWLYYYASKFDGPFSLPFIGNAHYFLGSFEDATDKVLKLANYNLEIVRLWIGKDLHILNSRPDHIEIILNKCLDKSPIYEIVSQNAISDSLLVSPVNHWKKNRKLINPTFNPTIVKSFQNIFAENSKILVDRLKDKCQKEIDIYLILWRTTLEMSSETLFDMDRGSFNNINEVLTKLMSMEEVSSKRLVKPWLYPTFFWKLSSIYNDFKILLSEYQHFVSNIIQMKKSQYINDEDKKLRFLNHLINNNGTNLSEKDVFDELQLMIIASSETTATAESFVLLVLAIIPEIQQKIFEEMYTIFGDSERDATLEDLNRMDYLERVIKETMRLFPPLLIIGRFLESDLKIDEYVFPKGSTIGVPIVHIHRTPKLWKDPLKFDPDRFLPEEIKRRHRCAYIPFSVGPRGCPGIQYSMVSLKTLLSTFIRHYKVISCNYQSLEDIKVVFNVITRTNKDFKVVLEKRV